MNRPSTILLAVALPLSSCATGDVTIQSELEALKSRVAGATAAMPELQKTVQVLDRQVQDISAGHAAMVRGQSDAERGIAEIRASLAAERVTAKLLSDKADSIAAQVQAAHALPLELAAAVRANQALLRETEAQIETIRARSAAALDLPKAWDDLRAAYVDVLESEHRRRRASIVQIESALVDLRKAPAGSDPSTSAIYLQLLETERRIGIEAIAQLAASLRRLRGDPPEPASAPVERIEPTRGR